MKQQAPLLLDAVLLGVAGALSAQAFLWMLRAAQLLSPAPSVPITTLLMETEMTGGFDTLVQASRAVM